MTDKRVKYAYVHEGCVYNQLDRTDLETHALAKAQSAAQFLDRIRQTDGIRIATIDESNKSCFDPVEIAEADVLIDNVSGADLEQCGAAWAFGRNASIVLACGGFEEVCTEGARDVFRRVGVDSDIELRGTVRLFDKENKKLYPPR